ncbi:MAG: tetratricopeptide repeat protein [Magnetococcales bacterium]|nr:tetratricopeptide repeat protein [Magnetococcales bacterium]
MTPRPATLEEVRKVAIDHFAAGRPEMALNAACAWMDRVCPDPVLLNLAAACRMNLGEPGLAEQLWRQALRLHPAYAEAYNNLGNLLAEAGRTEEAEAALREALRLNPNFAEVCYHLGTLLHGTGRTDEALALLERAVSLKPHLAAAHDLLGVILHRRGRLAEAETAFCRAIAAQPADATPCQNLAILLHEQERYAEAEAVLQDALTRHPDQADLHNLHGCVLRELDRQPEAEAAFVRALRPGHAEAYWHLGMLLLSQGRFAQGWPCYEARFHLDPAKGGVRLATPPLPLWQGEDPTGRDFLILAEQGCGDQIQFCRYVPWLLEQGARHITLVCHPSLERLLRSLADPGRLTVTCHAPEHPEHDYYTPLLSLPRWFDAIPAHLPYLAPPPQLAEAWGERLGPRRGFRVGLVWRGNPALRHDAKRSLPGLAVLAPLWEIPGVAFFSLQKGPSEEEARTPPPGQPLHCMAEALHDFADTAALLAHLDLVIGVDTAVLHLAGAMNTPCRLLLHAGVTDWRWQQQRCDSPWYPEAMRIFRQTAPGDWAGVVRLVKNNVMQTMTGGVS